MSLAELPDIEIVPVDPEEIRDSIITVYEAVSGRTLFPGDPVRLFLLAIAQIIIQQRALLNDAARQNLLRYARGDMLDQLGAYVETHRLPATAAVTTVRFTLSNIRPNATTIPAGTRVSPGSNLFFSTLTVAEIPAGETCVDVPCECMETGAIGNGFVAGQINILVDPIPYITSVSNITESSGGADVEPDDQYRERIYRAPERFSVAGPAGAYEYWARTANANILDVHVHSPAPAEVEIYVLMAGGELPASDILKAVEEAVTPKTRRPLTDLVTVHAPSVVNYEIDLKYWIDAENAAETAAIQTAVNQAAQDYILWQKSKIGRNINPSELIRRVMNAGARRVELMKPDYMVLDPTEIAIIDDPEMDVVITYGGLEDD